MRRARAFFSLTRFLLAILAAFAFLLNRVSLGLSLLAASVAVVALTDRAEFAYFISSMLSLFNPRLFVQMATQLVGEIFVRLRLLARGRSSAGGRPFVSYALPFGGRWQVARGGVTWRTSHSWNLIGQRYAYDFVALDARGERHRGAGRAKEDYVAYGQPVLAPADGVVVHVRDGVRDAPRAGTGWVDWLCSDFRGNFVVIEHATAEYSFLAHLVPGSLAVATGARVRQGQQVGLCGHSGHSTEPHLHFQVQDRASFFFAASLPVAFGGITVNGADSDAPVRLKTGDVIEKAKNSAKPAAGRETHPGPPA